MNIKRVRVIVGSVLVVLLILSVSFVVWRSYKTRTSSVRIGYIAFTGSLPVLVAKDRGLFAKHGLDVQLTKYPNDGAMLGDLPGGIDIPGPASLVSVANAEQLRPDSFKLLWSASETGDGNVSAILVPIDSPLKSITDLRGKSIGGYNSASAKVSLNAILEANGIKPDTDVKITLEPISTHLDLLISKQVDALYTVEPYSTMLIHKGQARLLVGNPRARYLADPFVVGVIAIPRDYWRNHPDETRRFVAAIAEAISLIQKDPTNTKQILASSEYGIGVSPEIAGGASNYVWETPSDSLKKAADENIRLFAKYGLVRSSQSAQGMWMPPSDIIH